MIETTSQETQNETTKATNEDANYKRYTYTEADGTQVLVSVRVSKAEKYGAFDI